MINQKELKSQLNYNPNTGEFTRIKSGGGRLKGSIAGYLNPHGHIRIQCFGIIHQAHRLAWLYVTGEWPTGRVDHINHVGNDNRWINLREATHQETARNTNIRKNNTSGVMGVSKHSKLNKWLAVININRRQVYLGVFDNKLDAARARKTAERKYGFHENHGQPRNA